jgi:co-chaperonin GroES (HSP10)
MIRVLGNRILLNPIPAQEQSVGGIILPQSQGDKKLWWTIAQLGTGRPGKNGVNPLDELRVGQSVCTPLFFTHTTLEDGSERKIVDVDQLIAVLE